MKKDDIQKIIIDKIKNALFRGIVLASVRSGKTRQLLTAIREMSDNDLDTTILVGYPNTDIQNSWIDECEKLEYYPNITYSTFKSLKKVQDNKYDFVIDSIDVIYCKIDLIEYCHNNNIKIISSMGFGNKMHPEMVEISTIDKTSICPMARSVRKILNRKKIEKIPVVYSKEKSLIPNKSILFKEEKPLLLL